MRFAVAFHDGAWEVMPYVDDVPLTELVTAYEGARSFDVVGGYDRAVLNDLGDAQRFLGRERPWPARSVSLLECDCGFPGCWPLQARIRRSAGRVVWDRFEQPHRPRRDYTDFGPFVFDEGQYRRALDEAVGDQGPPQAGEPA